MSKQTQSSESERLTATKHMLEQFVHLVKNQNLYSPSAEMDAVIHTIATSMVNDLEAYASTQREEARQEERTRMLDELTADRAETIALLGDYTDTELRLFLRKQRELTDPKNTSKEKQA